MLLFALRCLGYSQDAMRDSNARLWRREAVELRAVLRESGLTEKLSRITRVGEEKIGASGHLSADSGALPRWIGRESSAADSSASII